MKHFSIAFLLLLLSLTSQAQTTMRSLFVSMPDSIMPQLTHNNRLDLIDFLDAKMKAVVENRLGGDTQLLALTDDSLSLQMSRSLRIDITLRPSAQEYDSLRQVVCVEKHVFVLSDSTEDISRAYYSHRWRPLPSFSAKENKPIRPSSAAGILRKDAEIFEKTEKQQQ